MATVTTPPELELLETIVSAVVDLPTNPLAKPKPVLIVPPFATKAVPRFIEEPSLAYLWIVVEAILISSC